MSHTKYIYENKIYYSIRFQLYYLIRFPKKYSFLIFFLSFIIIFLNFELIIHVQTYFECLSSYKSSLLQKVNYLFFVIDSYKDGLIVLNAMQNQKIIS